MILCKLGLHSYGKTHVDGGGGSGNTSAYANYKTVCQKCGKVDTWTDHWKPSKDVIAACNKETQEAWAAAKAKKETPNAV